VTFTCHGLTDDQLRLMPSVSALVGKVLNSGVDSSRLDAQSDYIVNLLREGPVSKPKAMPAIAPAVSSSTVSAPSKGPKKEAEKEIIMYDYRGYKTSSLVGPMLILGDAGESKQYQKMLDLQKAGEWKKLLKEATHEFKKVPDWLTPYAFEAVALQHLGRTDEAIAALEYVDHQSVGNSDYDQARLLLKKLKPAQ
jgi:hypothetical protein